MADIGVQFTDLGNCLEFIETLLSNARRVRIRREQVDEIFVNHKGERRRYTAVVRGADDAALTLIQQLVRGKQIEDVDKPEGEPRTLNELLESIVLAPKPHPDAGLCLAVALFSSKPADLREKYSEMIQLGCRELQVGFVEPTAANRKLSHLILAAQVPKGFAPPLSWARHTDWGGRALAFYRIRPEDECPFYVEWGFEHPVPWLDKYYDYDKNSDRGLFVCAMDPNIDRTESEFQKGHAPYWLTIEQNDWTGIFHVPDEALDLEAMDVAPRVELTPRIDGDHGVLPLRVQPDNQAARGTLDAIESQIATHQQAIERLQRDRSDSLNRQGTVRIAYVFEQPLDGGDDEGEGAGPGLTATFERFMDQPYGFLEHFRYGFFDDPSDPTKGLHVVIDGRRVDHAQVMSQPIAEVYVQRQDWHGRLELFVRQGDILRPRIEDDEMITLMRRVIWEDHDHDPREPVFLRSIPGQGRAGWEAIYLEGMKSLTDSDVFRFFNERFPRHIIPFRDEVPDDVVRQIEGRRTNLDHNTGELEDQVVAAVTSRVDVTEDKWKIVSCRIDSITARMENHNVAIDKVETTIEAFKEEWDAFIGKVLQSDSDLKSTLVKAFSEYRDAATARDVELGAVEAAQLEVHTALEQDQEALDRRKEALEAAAPELENLAAGVSASFPPIEVRQREVEEAAKELNSQVQDRIRETESRIERSKQTVKTLDERKKNLDGKKTELDALAAQIANLERDVEALTQQIAALETQTAGIADELATKKIEHGDTKREFEARLPERREELDRENAAFASESAALGRELDAAIGTIGDVVNQRASIEGLTHQVSQFLEQLETERVSARGFAPVELDGEVPAAFLARLRDQLGAGEAGLS